jgi:hypothetical protein
MPRIGVIFLGTHNLNEVQTQTGGGLNLPTPKF